MLKVHVEVFKSIDAYERGDDPIAAYVMNHDSTKERRLLGIQCRNAFEAGQMIRTWTEKKQSA